MRLERNADNFGRDFFGDLKPWRETRPTNFRQEFDGNVRWKNVAEKFAGNSLIKTHQAQIKNINPNPLCRISGSTIVASD